MANTKLEALKGLEMQQWFSAAVGQEMGRRRGEFCQDEPFRQRGWRGGDPMGRKQLNFPS